MGSTGQRVSAFLLELQEELGAKDREIADLRYSLAQKAAEFPAGLRHLIEQQAEQLEHTRLILSALERGPFLMPSSRGEPEDPCTEEADQRIAQEEQASKLREDLEVLPGGHSGVDEVREHRAQLEEKRESHRLDVARLMNERETLRDACLKEERENARRQLEAEREAHQEEKARLLLELESARGLASALEVALIEQRGALQRIEAKFSLYSAAVSKLAQMPERKRPKLLESSRQVPQREQRNAFSIR